LLLDQPALLPKEAFTVIMPCAGDAASSAPSLGAAVAGELERSAAAIHHETNLQSYIDFIPSTAFALQPLPSSEQLGITDWH